MQILIRTIPHNDQVYETCGDYRIIPNPEDPTRRLEVVVSDLGDWKMEFLVGIHEAIEAGLMLAAGIPLESSTEFDVKFEEARECGWDGVDKGDIQFNYTPGESQFKFRGRWYPPLAEPGDSPDAPYARQHGFATAAERMLAAELGVDWKSYEDRCNSMSKEKS